MNARSIRRAASAALTMPMLLAAASPACATVFVYTATLSGAAAFPTNASAGSGTADVTYDDALHTMRVQASFAGLTGTTTAAFIHAATAIPGAGNAGVATTAPTFSGFPLGVTSGTYDAIPDLTQASSYNPAFVTANGGTVPSAEAALIAGIDAGEAYFSIHTTFFPGGEIRGFLTSASAVPEPASWAMMVAGFGFAGAAIRRQRRIVIHRS